MGKAFIPLTKWPLSLGKSALTTAISKTILSASTAYANDPTTEVELEGITVEATGKKTPAEVTALLSGALFTSSVIWGYKKLAYRDRLIVMRFIQRVVDTKKASINSMATQMARIMQLQNSSSPNVDDVDEALRLLDLMKEDAQILEGFLKMGSETNDLSKASLFNKKVKSGDFVTEAIVKFLTEEDIDIPKYEQSLKRIVDSNEFFNKRTIQAERELYSVIFDADDILGYREVLTEQIDAVADFLQRTKAVDIVEQADMPRWAGEEATEEGRWLRKQEKEAQKVLASVDEVTEKLEEAFDDLWRKQGIDPDTGKRSFKGKVKGVSGWVGRGLGKLLWVDGVIWVGTVAIDLSLNLFMDEDEQGFFSDRAGYSFVDEWVIVPILDWIFGDEDVQVFLIDIILELAETSDTLTGLVYGIIFWFAESFNAKVDLNVDRQGTGEFFLDSISDSFEPEYFLVAAFVAIVGLELWRSLLLPSWAILTGSIE